MFNDINECENDELICGLNAKCINHYGSYSCECLSGFIPVLMKTSSIDNEDEEEETYSFKCHDLDECSSECLNDCDPLLSVCINLKGGYACKCMHGYTGTGKLGQCVDVDECVGSELITCHENAKCVNTDGSVECKCEFGFFGNGTYCEGDEIKINEFYWKIDFLTQFYCKST